MGENNNRVSGQETAATAKANSTLPGDPGRHERHGQILYLEPRGLSRTQSAAYISVSPTKFDEMVRDGRMPPPKIIDRRKVWDRRQIDERFEDLPIDGSLDVNPWDEIL